MASPPTIAVYVSGHGFGHSTRTGVLLDTLARRMEVRLRVVTPCPSWLWPQTLGRLTTEWRTEACDIGVVQHDDISVDREATRRALEVWRRDYAARLQRETAWLSEGVDLVLADVPPLAFAAAAAAGVPSVALANFSWDWIYQAMGFARSASQAASAYRSATLLLELTPCAPMPAFKRRLSVGIVGAHPQEQREILRRRIGIESDQVLVVLAFRRPNHHGFVRLPPTSPRLRYLWPLGDISREDVVSAPQGLRFSQLLAAADVVVAKPGYGIIADAALCATPMLYTERRGFPEDEVLLAWISKRPGYAALPPEDLARGSWQEAIEDLLRAEPPLRVHVNGAIVAAEALVEILAGGSS